jgi:hypothetical protein
LLEHLIKQGGTFLNAWGKRAVGNDSYPMIILRAYIWFVLDATSGCLLFLLQEYFEPDRVNGCKCLKMRTMDWRWSMDMEMDLSSKRFQLAEEKGLCPECGAQMDEMSRLNEDGIAYVWLQCVKDGCSGRWLQKKRCHELKISTA